MTPDDAQLGATIASVAVGFDFDHTLGVDNGLERQALYAYARELGRPLDPDDAATHARIEEFLDRFRSNASTMDEMVAAFAAFIGAPGRPSAERWREHCFALVGELVRPIDGAVEAVAMLRAHGVPVAVLTNGWTPLQQKKIACALGDEALSLTILVSDVVGAKPSPAAFDALVAVLAVPRERCWYVGDNVRGDVAGALGAGLRAVWFDWEDKVYPQDIPQPTLRIGTLRELAQLVQNASAP